MEMRGQLLPTARLRAIQEEIAGFARPGHKSQWRIPLQDPTVMPCICNDPQIVGEIVYIPNCIYIVCEWSSYTYKKFELYIYAQRVQYVVV